MAKTKEKAAGAADNVKPFVERALRDQKLQDEVQNAFAVARRVYDEVSGAKNAQKAAQKMATDKGLHRDIEQAIEDLRHAALRLQGKRIKAEAHGKKKGRGGKLLVAGIALGILFNPVTGAETRKFVKDLVTGGGDFGGDFGSSNGGS